MPRNIRETVFDQSFATQERIDIILRSLHFICTQPKTPEQLENYVDGVKRLFKEAQAKMTQKEKEQSAYFVSLIGQTRAKHGNNLYSMYRGSSINPIYIAASAELRDIVDRYENFLIQTLDRHGMLMKDKASETEATKVY